MDELEKQARKNELLELEIWLQEHERELDQETYNLILNFISCRKWELK